MLKKRDLKRLLANALPSADIVLEANYLPSEFEALKRQHNVPADSSVVILVRDAATIVIATAYS